MKTLLLILFALGVIGCAKDEWQNYEMITVQLVSGDTVSVEMVGITPKFLTQDNNSTTVMVLYGREIKVSNIGLNEAIVLVRSELITLRGGEEFMTKGKKFVD
ncbi:hypothetical protein FKG96_09940 [Olivibacter sp. LS-1]|uniref:hypothetical protein n=1 Tax=Olivibacter sp. LS-1 TaxID=2592345 RepID=UPI0011EB5D46|nr:hypothetical protein [Olivibacter sp. LS-1]QEL01114.1 hypothetical protein FKG96_09940 [Olivibacter sp. LS-1]